MELMVGIDKGHFACCQCVQLETGNTYEQYRNDICNKLAIIHQSLKSPEENFLYDLMKDYQIKNQTPTEKNNEKFKKPNSYCAYSSACFCIFGMFQ